MKQETAKNYAKSAGREVKDVVVDDIAGADYLTKKGWRGRAAWALGLDPLIKGTAAAFRPCVEGGRFIGTLAKGAFKKEEVETLPTESTDAEERFNVACLYYGVGDETEIETRTRESYSRVVTWLLLNTAIIAWGIVGTSRGWFEGLPPLLEQAFGFYLLFATIPLMIRAAFWNFQLRNRALYSFGIWLNRPNEWFNWSNTYAPMSDKPRNPTKKKKGGSAAAISLLAVAAFLGWSLLADPASAATPIDSLPQNKGFTFTENNKDTDLFHHMLTWIAPGVGSIGENDATPFSLPLWSALQAFSASLLTLGAMMMAWHTVAGMVATAKDGKPLGARWNYIWAPVRVSVGVASLTPAIGGLGAAQLAILQLITWGGGMANHTWDAFVSNVASPPGVAFFKSTDPAALIRKAPNSTLLMKEIVNKEMCYATLSDLRKDDATVIAPKKEEDGGWFSWIDNLGLWADEKKPILLPNEYPTLKPWMRDPTTWQTVSSFGDAKAKHVGYYIDYGVCGQITFGFYDAMKYDDILKHSAYEYGMMAEGFVAEINEKRAMFIKAFSQNLVKLARGADEKQPDAEKLEPELNEGLAKARDAYSLAVWNFAESLQDLANDRIEGDARDELLKNAQELGWMSSGMFYVTLGRLQGQLFELATIPMTVTPIQQQALSPRARDALYNTEYGQTAKDGFKTPGVMVVLEQYWNEVLPKTPTVSEIALTAGVDKGALETANDSNTLAGDTMEWLYDDLDNVVAQFMQLNPTNPLSSIIAIGQSLLDTGQNLFIWTVAMTGGAIAAGAIGAAAGATGGSVVPGVGNLGGGALGGAAGVFFGTVASSALSGVAGILQFATLIALGVGGFFAFYVPMMPYVAVFFAGLGLMILTAEALIAAPIWAFMHIRMDGEDFVDSVQKPGYMIAFNLLLRPTLILLGLLLSFGVLAAGAAALNATLFPAMKTITYQTGYGFVGYVAFIAIGAYITWQLVSRSFALITEVPDRVIRWFGQGGENLGEKQSTDQTTSFFAGAATGQLGNMLPRNDAGGAFEKAKGATERKNEKRQRKYDEDDNRL